ncbi:MAG: 2-octaprenyl-6-methoxyphenyl hydroxylase [Gammaproteobacteria bacterium]|nr:2-octaprenyl-6-methoxyphenyl hydroxylase [Gammaproteobacteria bacterium]
MRGRMMGMESPSPESSGGPDSPSPDAPAGPDSPSPDSPSPDSPHRPDVIVIGGGLVGGALALALAADGAAVAVVEAAPAAAPAQPSFDARTLALTDNARRIFAGLGVWDDIAAHAEAILDIHISERGGCGMTHLSCADVGGDALGYVVPSRAVGQALHRRLREHPAVEFHCPATAENLRQGRAEVTVSVSTAADGSTASAAAAAESTVTLAAPLLALADGGRSKLGAQTVGRAAATAYRQCAIVCVVETDRAHRGRAFERFTAEGPLALLPHSARRYAVVWSSELKNADARMALSDDDFVDALQAAFGDRAGNFSRPTARARYPLEHGAAARPAGRRVVSIGNAAHRVHPVAGQGFNLGLRDAVALAAVVAQARRENRDLGCDAVLAQYAELRRRETARVGAFTDGLIRVFGNRAPAMRLVRNLGLAGLEFCPPAKRFLLRRTMGAAAMTELAALAGAR